MNTPSQDLGTVVRSLAVDMAASCKNALADFDMKDFISKRRQVLADGFRHKPWALALRILILWPIGLLVVVGTLSVAAIWTKEVGAVWNALLLPVYYLIVIWPFNII